MGAGHDHSNADTRVSRMVIAAAILTAFVLNILPVPGLDGYSALEPHLSPQTQRALQPSKQWAFFILLLLLFTPQVNRWFFGMVFWFFDASGVPRWLIGDGMDFARFWSAWF